MCLLFFSLYMFIFIYEYTSSSNFGDSYWLPLLLVNLFFTFICTLIQIRLGMDIIKKYKFESDKQTINQKNKNQNKLNVTLKMDVNNKYADQINKIKQEEQQRKINNYLDGKPTIKEIDNSINHGLISGKNSGRNSGRTTMIENLNNITNNSISEDNLIYTHENNSEVTESMIYLNDDFENNNYSDVYIKKRM